MSDASWGGTTALTWLDETFIQAKPELCPYLDQYTSNMQTLDIDRYMEESRQTREFMTSDEMIAFREKIDSGHINPIILIKAIKYQKKLSGTINQMGPHYINRPAGLYHSMVEKIAGYTCAGVIWYQGENDEDKADLYDSLFSSIIECWRGAWKDDFPFLFVQLAPFGKRLHLNGDRYPIVRQKQEWVSKNIPDAYMVSIMDAGEKKDIHPKNKRPVGERLALMAMGKVYGENILCEAPEMVSGMQSNGSIKLEFANAGDGLALRGEKMNALILQVNGKNIKNFNTVVANETIEILSKKIEQNADCRVLFAQTGYCEVNLYSSEGLPV